MLASATLGEKYFDNHTRGEKINVNQEIVWFLLVPLPRCRKMNEILLTWLGEPSSSQASWLEMPYGIGAEMETEALGSKITF